MKEEEMEMSPVERKDEVMWESQEEKGKNGESAKLGSEEASRVIEKSEIEDAPALGITVGETKGKAEEEAKEVLKEQDVKVNTAGKEEKEEEMQTVEL
jgi:hypothetical protein